MARQGRGGEGELVRLRWQVVEFFDGDTSRAALWFWLPNPLLGDISPRDMIRYGRYAKLQEFVTDALTENATAAEGRVPRIGHPAHWPGGAALFLQYFNDLGASWPAQTN